MTFKGISKASENIKDLLYLENFKISDKRKKIFYVYIIVLCLFILVKASFYYDLKDFQEFEIFVNLAIFYTSVLLITNFLRILIVSSYRKRNKYSVDFYDNFILGFSGVTNVIIFIIFFFGTLYFFNVRITAFLTSLGLFSVALAWIFKEYISNLLDGIAIMFSNNIRLGDYIKVNDYKGIVKHITFLNIELKTDEGDIVYVPNHIVFSNEVTNYNKVKYKRIIFPFSLYDIKSKDLEKLEKYIIKKLVKKFPDLSEERYFLRINHIKHDSIDFVFEVSIKKYSFTIEDEIKKEISVEIIKFKDKISEDRKPKRKKIVKSEEN